VTILLSKHAFWIHHNVQKNQIGITRAAAVTHNREVLPIPHTHTQLVFVACMELSVDTKEHDSRRHDSLSAVSTPSTCTDCCSFSSLNPLIKSVGSPLIALRVCAKFVVLLALGCGETNLSAKAQHQTTI